MVDWSNAGGTAGPCHSLRPPPALPHGEEGEEAERDGGHREGRAVRAEAQQQADEAPRPPAGGEPGAACRCPPPQSPCLCLPVSRHVVASLDMGAGAGLADEACVLPAAQWDELEQLGEAVRRGPTPLIALAPPPLAHCVCGITADRRRDGAGRDDAARRGG